jgi:putative salt-induced outer membrane protein YdiY
MKKTICKLIRLSALAPLAFSLQTLAEEVEKIEEPVFKASVEFGFLYKTGNTKSTDLKTGASLSYETEKWLSALDFNFLIKKSEVTDDTTGETNFVTQDNKWDITGQSNYSLDEGGKHYLYGNVSYETDEFSNFSKQSSASAGWGRSFENEEKTWSLFMDVGPGVKHDVIRATDTTPEETTTDFIVQAQALYLLAFNEHVDFKQHFVLKQAVESAINSIYKSETSLTAALIDSMQVKISFRVDYDTEVEPDFEHLNTETSVTLVYNF